LDTTHHFEHEPRAPYREKSDAKLGSVEILAEEFLERQRRGGRPEISEYTDLYPELADRIRAFFPALVLGEWRHRGGQARRLRFPSRRATHDRVRTVAPAPATCR
jgi:hypothetical protein